MRPFGARAATEGRPYTEGRGDRRDRGELRFVMITTSPLPSPPRRRRGVVVSLCDEDAGACPFDSLRVFEKPPLQ